MMQGLTTQAHESLEGVDSIISILQVREGWVDEE
jgi:hypothetical protein